MARLHCDEEIRVSYVREVCRLLKISNLNIRKEDITMEEQNQEMINVERQQARDQENANIQSNNGHYNGTNNLFVSYPPFYCFRTWKKSNYASHSPSPRNQQ